MALKDFVSKGGRPDEGMPATRARPVETAGPGPGPVQRSSPPAALLDASVEFTGTMRCRESIRIDGRCEGELFCEHAVIVGEPAVLRMSIEADSVAVAGRVDGDITARRKITLEPTARVNGNLCTPGIVIQEGAKLEGRIVIGSEQTPGKPARSATAEPATQQPAEPAEAGSEERPEPAAARPRKPPTAPPPAS